MVDTAFAFLLLNHIRRQSLGTGLNTIGKKLILGMVTFSIESILHMGMFSLVEMLRHRITLNT
jgi:hypothetical protein